MMADQQPETRCSFAEALSLRSAVPVLGGRGCSVVTHCLTPVMVAVYDTTPNPGTEVNPGRRSRAAARGRSTCPRCAPRDLSAREDRGALRPRRRAACRSRGAGSPLALRFPGAEPPPWARISGTRTASTAATASTAPNSTVTPSVMAPRPPPAACHPLPARRGVARAAAPCAAPAIHTPAPPGAPVTPWCSLRPRCAGARPAALPRCRRPPVPRAGRSNRPMKPTVSYVRVHVKADRAATGRLRYHSLSPISVTKRLTGPSSVVSMMTFRVARVKAT